MLSALDSSLLLPLVAILRQIPRLTPRSHFAGGFSAFGLLYFLLLSSVLAGEVTIAWDPTPDASVAGYRLYYGSGAGNYEGVQDVGLETSYTLAELEEGRAYYFVLVPYDSSGEEGELSEEIAYNDPQMGAETEVDETEIGEPDEPGELEVDEFDGMSPFESDVEDNPEHEPTEEIAHLQAIPQGELSIVSVDSETLVGDGAADSAIDGRVETFWQTARGARAPLPPHELVIALGGEYRVIGLRYLPRQDGKTDGMVGRYRFYVSEDGKEWGQAVATGTFARDKAVQEVTFPGKEGSFVRFEALSEIHGNAWTSVAEITVLGSR